MNLPTIKNPGDAQMFPSLLDRLVGQDWKLTSVEARLHPRRIADQVIESIMTDVEKLLNTRVSCVNWPAHLTELDTSIVNYGMPDFAGCDLSTADDREQFRAAIQDAIRRFEPRLRDVDIQVFKAEDDLDNRVRLEIRARVGSVPDFVSFGLQAELVDAMLQFRISD